MNAGFELLSLTLYRLVNFNGIFESMNLVVRVSTGEDWHQLLWDTMVSIVLPPVHTQCT